MYTDYIPNVYGLYSEFMQVLFQEFMQILFRIYSEYIARRRFIPNMFRIYSEYIYSEHGNQLKNHLLPIDNYTFQM